MNSCKIRCVRVDGDMQEGAFEVLHREIEVVCKPSRCIQDQRHPRIGQAGLLPHLQDEETSQKHARPKGQWGCHIEEAHDPRYQFGSGRCYEQLGERMQLSMQLVILGRLAA